MNRRKFHRFQVELRCSFLTDQFTGEGTTLDLSMEGCRMRGDAPLVKGQYVELFINLLGEIAPLTVELAVIRWSGETAFGVEFIRIANRHQSRLRHYLRNLEQALMPCALLKQDDLSQGRTT
jgi:PilZ domain